MTKTDNIIKTASDRTEALYWLWILDALGGKSYKASKLCTQIASAAEIYRADFGRLSAYEGIDGDDIEALCSKDLSAAENYMRFCTSKGVRIILHTDDEYPIELKETDGYPAVLFAYGNVEEAFAKPKIAIVGTRECTAYGEKCTKELAFALSKTGFAIVTGVARGIDTAAIEGAVAAHGSIIAMLPGGHLNTHFNSSYKFKELHEHGVLLSEHLPNTQTHKFSYHERNRLISGLSLGTVVTQAPLSSGALITASHAINQNRDVFALISNTDMDQAKGSNNLLREGAVPLIDYKDIVNFYRFALGDRIDPDTAIDFREITRDDSEEKDIDTEVKDFKRIAGQHLTFEETTVFDCIGLNETDIDSIIEKTGYPVSTVMSILSSLEATGAITPCPGNKYKISL